MTSIYFWRLINDKRAILRGNLNHEITANDLYASLIKSGLDFEWEPVPELGKLLPDRAFTAYGKQFYIENHTGTQTVDTVIPEKIENYIRYAASGSRRFHTLFVTHDYTRFLPKKATIRADETANQILDVIEPYHRGNQFSVCLYEHFMKHPLGKILVASYEKGLVSLEDL